MKYGDLCVVFLIMSTGVVLGLLIALMAMSSSLTPIHELGNAICDQEYDMQFDSYDDKKLKCKPKLQEEPYDGIVIDISDRGGE